LNDPNIFALNKELTQVKRDLANILEENLSLLAKVQQLERERYAAVCELDKTVKHSEEVFKSLTSRENDDTMIVERSE
jgi:hypothetical protein